MRTGLGHAAHNADHNADHAVTAVIEIRGLKWASSKAVVEAVLSLTPGTMTQDVATVTVTAHPIPKRRLRPN
jgi:Cu2+-exporting ATPase